MLQWVRTRLPGSERLEQAGESHQLCLHVLRLSENFVHEADLEAVARKWPRVEPADKPKPVAVDPDD
jgi:hypothetical protein